MFVLGLTGGLGAGKSTVARMLRRLGAKVLDADELAKDALKKGGRAYKKVLALFGSDVLTGQRIDRRKVAAVVFKDKNSLRMLNAAVHPVVIDEIKKRLRLVKKENPAAIVVLDAPLLLEAGARKSVDALAVVKAKMGQQLERSAGRLKITKEEAARRIKSQMAIERKLKLADYVIDNSGTLDETLKQARTMWNKIKSEEQGWT